MKKGITGGHGGAQAPISAKSATQYAAQIAAPDQLPEASIYGTTRGMNFTRRNETLYIRKRVPRRYRPVEDREFLWVSLHTDSEAVAKVKAPQIWAQMIEAWEAKLAGASAEAEDRVAAAKNLAQMKGYRFMHAPDVAKLPLAELVDRLEQVTTAKGKIDMPMAEAVLGLVEAPKLTVNRAIDLYWGYAEEKTLGKSADQVKRMKAPREKAIRNFVKLKGDLIIDQITRDDLEDFKAWWLERVKAGKTTANSANKDLVYLTSTLRAVALRKSVALRFTTDKLAIPEGKKNTRPPFSSDWIRDRLLAPGALDGLNAEARCILLGMVNTGYRPSEGAQLTSAQIRLDVDVPHIQIEGVGRTLKSAYAERRIPLCGVSLQAFRQFPNGFPRYADNPTLSDTVNKFLRENRLLETEGHSLYSLRHSFEDRLLAAGADDRIRADLMGHRIKRERYGAGASLEHLQAILQRIAF